MENALFYTLSTISQTLAGALAVMVAFVLLKLPAMDSDIRRARLYLKQWDEIVPVQEMWAVLPGVGLRLSPNPSLEGGSETPSAILTGTC